LPENPILFGNRGKSHNPSPLNIKRKNELILSAKVLYIKSPFGSSVILDGDPKTFAHLSGFFETTHT
jgi:hypothetical protein